MWLACVPRENKQINVKKCTRYFSIYLKHKILLTIFWKSWIISNQGSERKIQNHGHDRVFKSARDSSWLHSTVTLIFLGNSYFCWIFWLLIYDIKLFINPHKDQLFIFYILLKILSLYLENNIYQARYVVLMKICYIVSRVTEQSSFGI